MTALTLHDGVLRVAVAQLPNVVGDLDGNGRRILEAMSWAEDAGADVVVFPELALTGYPPGDLVAREDFVDRAQEVLEELAASSGSTVAVVSSVIRVPPRRSWDARERSVAIAAAVLCDGQLRGTYHKVLLPNYQIFNEARSFAPGEQPGALWRIGEAVAGIAICEDLWSGDGPPERQAAAGARILLVPNASPFYREKSVGRLQLARQVARRNGVPVVYVNCVGGHDDLVFDGGSIVVDSDGELLHRARQFAPESFVLDVPLGPPRQLRTRVTTAHARPARPRGPLPAAETTPQLSDDEQVWAALVLGTRDFVRGNGATEVVLGLSGGIDAAICASVAADALGPENVLGVAMPGPNSPVEELKDARTVAGTLGIRFAEIPIAAATHELSQALSAVIGTSFGPRAGAALETRSRTAIVWAICDELGALQLATGNKSELSIGAASLRGDMAGAFAPLRDCPKTLLHRLALQRNARSPVIPARVLSRTSAPDTSPGPAAPPYDELDAILERYLELGESAEALIADGLDSATIRYVLQLVDDAELERRQTPPGVRITQRAFGQDRRMPITNAWRPFAATPIRPRS